VSRQVINNTNEKRGQKEKVLSGLIWTFGERITAQGVSFVLSIILARILMPEEYGLIAMVMVFINIANVFTNGGFGEALVQKKDSDETEFSTMFFCTLGVSMVIYIVLFIFAPFISEFYRTPAITWVLRILAFKIIISSLSTIQHAYVQKYMLFRKFFFSTLGGTLFSGIIGIAMAKAGFGVWALVAQYLSNTTIDTIVLLMTVSWRPHLTFSKKSAIELMNFGWKMVLANLVNAIYNELRSIIIGRSYSSADLAYYNKGNQIPSLAITNIDTAIGNVIFPAMSTAESPEKLKTIGRRAMKTTSYIIFPIMVGLIVVSRPLITLLLTKKWDSSIIYMQILCIYWMTQPIQTTNWQIIKAMGRSDLCLKLELLKKAIGIIMVVAAMFISVKAIAISAAVFGVISMIINILPNKKLINYSIIEQMLDIIPALGISIVMGVIVYLCSYMTLPTIVILIIQVIVGVTIYVCLSYILRLDSYMYLIGVVKNRRK
jgi:O-antigen/teichoic acid export membrane protein